MIQNKPGKQSLRHWQKWREFGGFWEVKRFESWERTLRVTKFSHVILSE